jgi:hypothetical protein
MDWVHTKTIPHSLIWAKLMDQHTEVTGLVWQGRENSPSPLHFFQKQSILKHSNFISHQ